MRLEGGFSVTSEMVPLSTLRTAELTPLLRQSDPE